MTGHRGLLLIALLGTLFRSFALLGRASAQTTSEHVVVTPGEGTLQSSFTFVGMGFTPGRTVSVRITSPDGIERRFLTDDGSELVWLVQPDGTFSLEFVPALRFPGGGPGRWRALFCSFGAPTCQLVDFDAY